MSNNLVHTRCLRRASAHIAQFTAEDAQGNVFSFERRLSNAALHSFRALRGIVRATVRGHVTSATVQLPGRDEIAIIG